MLKTIILLRKQGISTYKIRKSIACLKKYFPWVRYSLIKNQLIVFGNKIVFVHKGRAFEAESGQEFCLDFAEIENWTGKVIEINSYSNTEGVPVKDNIFDYLKPVKVNL